MAVRRFALHAALAVVVISLTYVMGFYIRDDWQEAQLAESKSAASVKPPAVQDGTSPVRISREARKNMGVVSTAQQVTVYLRKIDVPGVVTDRRGVRDRGVVAPVTGIVTRFHAFPGNTVAPIRRCYRRGFFSFTPACSCGSAGDTPSGWSKPNIPRTKT